METSTTPDLEHHGRRLSRVMVVILVAYVAFILVLMTVRGAYMSPDLFVVLALVIVVVMGRTRLFLRDWLPRTIPLEAGQRRLNAVTTTERTAHRWVVHPMLLASAFVLSLAVASEMEHPSL